ncbi:hypothetical protein BKA63DRAFT_495188 [Paraphoma chrysanthemicola]|nr:hypothetical protein BKA63DRAFT_495188 [Paraphoma chrysanthemicola]
MSVISASIDGEVAAWMRAIAAEFESSSESVLHVGFKYGQPLTVGPSDVYVASTATHAKRSEDARGLDLSGTITHRDLLACAFCYKIGDVLPCCKDITSPCRHCARLAVREEEYESQLVTLRAKTTRLESETPEQRQKRLCAEKNAKIDQLRREVEKVRKEGQQLYHDFTKREETLAAMQHELGAMKAGYKIERRQEYTMKEAKGKKGRNKR